MCLRLGIQDVAAIRVPFPSRWARFSQCSIANWCVHRPQFLLFAGPLNVLLSSMAGLETLEARAKELRRLSKQIDQQIRDVERKAKGYPGGLPAATPWARSAALRVWALAGYDVATAVEYLRWKGRRGGEDEVRAWCSGVSESQRLCLASPPDGEQQAHRQLREARKFLEEKAVVAWVKKQNEAKGLAPAPGVILDQVALAAQHCSRRSSRCKRLRRVAARWGGRKALFRPSDRVPLEVFRHKAAKTPSGWARLVSSLAIFICRFAGSIPGPETRLSFWALLLIALACGGPDIGPPVGPDFGARFGAGGARSFEAGGCPFRQLRVGSG
jgi:hypothetical protein